MRVLPEWPWDRLAPFAERARAHPDGIVDLSVGTPVDPTPAVARAALAAAADAPGYPLTAGSAGVRDAAVGWLRRRFAAAVDPASVLPVIGTKELVAALPTLLGAGTVVFPTLAYPTYDIGARLAGARGIAADAGTALGAEPVDLVWVNSPGNPTGQVLSAAQLRTVVSWARDLGAVVASDECYAELYYDGDPPCSILSPEVCDGDPTGLLAVHSLSKRSNIAGYRAGFLAGDPELVAAILAVRKHAGLIVPGPVQAAMAAVLDDDGHVAAQRARYRARRASLWAAVVRNGFRVEHSEAGLYLWATRGEDCWASVAALAERGILVAPGEFYGAAGGRHVRIALTATDERIAAAVARLEPAGH